MKDELTARPVLHQVQLKLDRSGQPNSDVHKVLHDLHGEDLLALKLDQGKEDSHCRISKALSQPSDLDRRGPSSRPNSPLAHADLELSET